MSFKVTNNSTKFILELSAKLQTVPKGAETNCVIAFSEVQSLLLDVWSAFIIMENNDFRMFLRIWDDERFNNNLGLFFPDKIKFKEDSFLLSQDNCILLHKFLNNKIEPPEKIKGILLDGSSYRLKIKHASGTMEFFWNLTEQLNGNLAELFNFIETEKLSRP